MAENTLPFPRPSAEPLLRELVGDRLRRLRREQDQTLTEVAQRAGISPQYLSEIERGLKEPSSEMIAAVCGALGSSLLELTAAVASDLAPVRTARRLPARPIARDVGRGGAVLALAG